MTVAYDCTVDLLKYDDLTAKDVDEVKSALNAECFDWYIERGKLYIEGWRRIDGRETRPADIADTIKWLLWKTAEIDANVRIETFSESEERESNFDEQRRYFYSGL